MAGLQPTRGTNTDIEDYTWLASAADVEYAQSGTLNAASFAPAGGHKVENWIKSGTPLGLITSAGATKGQFALYTTGASDGSQTHVGFLAAPVQLTDPVTGQANVPITGGVLRTGQIIVNRLPVTFDPAGAGADKAHFVYR